MSTSSLHAVVIGAGLGGLAAAIRLQAQGHHATVVESQPALGGRASRLQDAGYTWDTGPSLITMPWLLDELYALAGTSRPSSSRCAGSTRFTGSAGPTIP